MNRYHASLLIAGLSALTLVVAAPPRTGGLTVHEWGTFTSVAGDDGKSVLWSALGKRDLPEFIEDAGYRCTKWSLTGSVRMETPVIYFYSPHELSAHVSVRFPYGVMSEWYPRATVDIYQSKTMLDRMDAATASQTHMNLRSYGAGDVYPLTSLVDPPPAGLDPLLAKLSPSRNGIDTSMRALMGSIEWNDLKIQPGLSADLPDDHSGNRYYSARQTDSAPVTVGNQHEKFLFYRGVARFQVPLTAQVSPTGKVALANTGSEPVPAVFLFENRKGQMRYRRLGAVETSTTGDLTALGGSLPELRYDLEEALVSQGLFRKEAHAMVETWADSWFEEGVRAMYILPARTVDSVLPLKVEPAPEQVVRVFVGRIELFTAEALQAVEQAAANGDVSIAARYGRFLDPILERVQAAHPQVASRIQGLRSKIDLGDWCQ
jgi:hypothetical protein